MTRKSPRSVRTKAEARSRADVTWYDPRGKQSLRLASDDYHQAGVLGGGSELSQLIAEADAHLSAMRKIVQ